MTMYKPKMAYTKSTKNATNQNSHKTNNQYTPHLLRHNRSTQEQPPLAKVLKVSIEKSQQIGQNQYKKAMRHMIKVDSLEKKQKEKKIQQIQQLTDEHTFKPKINKPSKTSYMYESLTHSMQKIRFNTHSKERNPNEKIYDRLIKWGHNHTDRVRDNYLKGNVKKDSVEKSVDSRESREKWMGWKEKGQNLENTRASIEKMEQRFLNSLRSSHQTKREHVKVYANGQQSFYQRQAKAVALKNGQTYYYSTHLHTTS